MGRNLVQKTYLRNDTWVAPAGVTMVTAAAIKPPSFGSCFLSQNVSVNSFGGQRGSNFLLDNNGVMYGWGTCANGQLGDGTVVTKSSPVPVLGGLFFTDMIPGGDGYVGTTMALDYQGKAWAWGANIAGEIGDGTVVAKSSPIAVLGGLKFYKLRSRPGNGGPGSSIGITQAGKAYCWGGSTKGELGDGTVVAKSSPVAVLGGLTFVDIVTSTDSSSSAGFCLGITAAGVAYGWGSNTYGQLGVGDVTARSSPVAVLGGLAFRKIKVSTSYCYGITTSGVLYAWGANGNGHLGVGDAVSKSSPVAVLGGLTVSDVFMGQYDGDQSFLITTGGDMYAWGLNTSGQLGVGDSTRRSSPVLVLGGLKWSFALNDGNDTSIGITTSGDLYAWGANANGQLGDGTVVSKSSPVPVLGGLKWYGVAASLYGGGFFGVTTSGVPYAWGLNTSGAGGLGDATPRSSPVAVLGGLIARIAPIAQRLSIPVVPGTTYTISVGPYQAMFGNTVVGVGATTSLVVEYQN